MNPHLARDHQQLPGLTVSSLWHKNLKLWWKNFLLEPGSIYGSRCLVVHYFTNVSLSNMWHHLGDKFATDANLGGRICYQWDNFCYGLISEPVSSDLCSGIVVLLWYCFGTVLVLLWYCCGTSSLTMVPPTTLHWWGYCMPLQSHRTNQLEFPRSSTVYMYLHLSTCVTM